MTLLPKTVGPSKNRVRTSRIRTALVYSERTMPESPNLVFIFSDRQRYDTLAAYGNDWIQTPNLNGLSDESAVFEHCYVTQPVCAPARSSIMTGLYPHTAGMPRNKIAMPNDVRTAAQMVSDDYRKAYFGKWHLGDEVVRQRGFDEWVSVMDRLWTEYTKEEYLGRFSDYRDFLVGEGFEPDFDVPGGRIFSDLMRAGLPKEYQQATFLAEKAEQFIQENAGRPYVLYVSMLEPHPPFTGPYDHLYDPQEMPVDPTFLVPPDGHSLFSRLRSQYFMNADFDGHDLSTEAGWRRLRANYMANITLVDDAAGRIVSAVEESGQGDNTIVVFTSEHGDLVGSHGMLEMRTFYEAACKVPLMIRVPWLDGGPRTIGGNFGQIDLLPTLLDLMGQPLPDVLQGTSRSDVLEGRATLDGNDVFMQHNGVGDRDLTSEESRPTASPELADNVNYMNTLPWRSVVTADRWKLNLCVGDQCELFDLNSDPNEFTNLFNEPERRDRIRTMAARLRLWQQETGDTAPLPAV